jgi:hypothetical protein
MPSNGKNKRSERKRTTLSMVAFRSALTNGSSLFVDRRLDQRSTLCRRLRDLIALHVRDLGGEDNVSEAERRLIRRAAMLTLQLELMEQRWAANEDQVVGANQLDVYQRMTGALRRVLETLGLQRRLRDVTPTLSDILRAPPPTNGEEAEP